MTDAKTRIEAYLAERDRRQMNDRDGGHIHGLGVNTLVLHDSDLREVISAMPRWHRIDDPEHPAPRDGTRFWGRADDDAIAMLWHDEFEAFVSSWRQLSFAASYGGGVRNHSPEIHTPTEWMPLPAPPEAE